MMLVFLTSCWDDSYRGQTDRDAIKYEAAEIEVSVGSYEKLTNQKSATRGSGPIEDKDDMQWKNDIIYIYSFKKDAVSYVPKSSEGDFEQFEPPVCIVDGSRDNKSSKLGKMAHLTDFEFIEWDVDDYRLKYPGGFPNGRTAYDFFGYFVDSLKVDESTISRTTDSISFPVEIDGTRDYMTAYSVLTNDQLDATSLPRDERAQMYKYAFSSYSANVDLHPKLYFDHWLCRLDFELYPGGINCDSLYVQKIEIKAKTKANMTVVHRDKKRIGLHYPSDTPYEYIALKEENSKDIDPEKYMLEWKDDYSTTNPHNNPMTKMGGSLLLAPEKEYEMIVHMRGKAGDGSFVERPVTQILQDIDEQTQQQIDFTAGKKYGIMLSIYGVGDIRINVTTLAWDDGGDVVIDGEEWGQ